MLAGCRDRVVADGVALGAGAPVERALDQPLALGVCDTAGRSAMTSSKPCLVAATARRSWATS